MYTKNTAQEKREYKISTSLAPSNTDELGGWIHLIDSSRHFSYCEKVSEM